MLSKEQFPRICEIIDRCITMREKRGKASKRARIRKSRIMGYIPDEDIINGRLLQSFQIRLGNCTELMSKELAALLYGISSLPRYTNGIGVTQEEAQRASRPFYEIVPDKQQIISRVCPKKVKAAIMEKLSTLESDEDNLIDDSFFAEIKSYVRSKVPASSKVYTSNVDFLLVTKNKIIAEIKTSGEIDSGKTAITLVANLLTPYCLLDDFDFKYGLFMDYGPHVRDLGLPGHIMHSHCLVEEEWLKLVLPQNIDANEVFDYIAKRVGIAWEEFKNDKNSFCLEVL